MKPNSELLKMYKEEKSLVIGAPEVRTGLEDFPPFSEWKQQYVDEYNATHVTVTVEEADAQFDEVVDEAEAELQAAEEGAQRRGTSNEKELGTEEGAAGAPTRNKAGTASKGRGAPTEKKVGRSKSGSRGGKRSKTEIAQSVFNQMYPKVVEGKKKRKDVIDKMVQKAGLTANGAATYYQRFKRNW